MNFASAVVKTWPQKTEGCMAHICHWMNNNMLNFNKAKIDFIVFIFKQHVKKTENLHIKVESIYIYFSMFVKNLG